MAALGRLASRPGAARPVPRRWRQRSTPSITREKGSTTHDRQQGRWRLSPVRRDYVRPEPRYAAVSRSRDRGRGPRSSIRPRAAGCFDRQQPTATGSASSKATRSSNRNTSCCWPSSAASDDRGLRQGVPLPPRPAAARRRLGDLPRRPGRGQRLGQGVLRPEARRASRPTTRRMVRAREAILDAGGAAGLQQLHAVLPRPARPDRATTTARACRPSWCCCRAGSTSASTRCRPGPGRSSCRCRSSRPTSRCGSCRRSGASPSCSATDRAAARPRTPTRSSSRWTNFFLGVDRVLKWADRWLPALLAAAGHRRPRTAGCSSTSRTPTASGRSSRR